MYTTFFYWRGKIGTTKGHTQEETFRVIVSSPQDLCLTDGFRFISRMAPECSAHEASYF
jgi:hypothetical protein